MSTFFVTFRAFLINLTLKTKPQVSAIWMRLPFQKLASSLSKQSFVVLPLWQSKKIGIFYVMISFWRSTMIQLLCFSDSQRIAQIHCLTKIEIILWTMDNSKTMLKDVAYRIAKWQWVWCIGTTFVMDYLVESKWFREAETRPLNRFWLFFPSILWD